MTLSVDIALGQLLLLEVISRYLGSRSGFGIRNLIDEHIQDVVASHLGRHGEVTDHDVLLLLHIVVVVVAVGVAPFAVVVVFLIVVALAVPEAGFQGFVFTNGGLHLFGGEGVVGGTEVEAQLIHRAGLHFDVIRKHDGEGLPLVGVWVVDGEAHFLLQTTRLADAVSLLEFVVLQERQDVVVEDTDNPQGHRVKADGIEIDGGFIHIGDDDTIVGPTHLGQVVGEVEIVGVFALQQHAIGGTNATTDRHVHLLKLITIQGGLVEEEINLISLDVKLVANSLIEIDETAEVLVFFQGLREEQRTHAGRLVDIKHQRLESVFGKHCQVAHDVGLAVDSLAVEHHMALVILVLALQVLDQDVENVVARVAHLNGVVFAEPVVEQLFHVFLLDGGGEGHAQQVAHLLVRRADGLDGHKAKVLTAHAKTELKHLVVIHIHEIRHLELADIVLVLVDVVVLEADGVLVDPHCLTFQGRRKVEGLGGNLFAVFHFECLGVAEAHHDGLASDDGA